MSKWSFRSVVILLMAAVRLAHAQPTPAPTTAPAITDKLMANEFSKARPTGTRIDTVMLHFVSDVLAHPDDPFNVDEVIKLWKDPPASAHYMIDRDGTIYRLVKEERQAFHAGKGELPFEPKRKDSFNVASIGIEMLAVGSKADMTAHGTMAAKAYDDFAKKHPEHIGFTEKQYVALNALLKDIRARNTGVANDRKHILAHSEYAPTRRTDPGQFFDWTKIGLTTNIPE